MIAKILIVIFSTIYTTTTDALPLLSKRMDETGDIIDLSHLGPNIYGDPDNKIGDIVSAYNSEDSPVNPEELGDYFEGDILMPKTMGRIGLLASSAKWSNGIIPFEIRGNFGTINFGVLVLTFTVSFF